MPAASRTRRSGGVEVPGKIELPVGDGADDTVGRLCPQPVTVSPCNPAPAVWHEK